MFYLRSVISSYNYKMPPHTPNEDDKLWGEIVDVFPVLAEGNPVSSPDFYIFLVGI